jgi:hypothetical protein
MTALALLALGAGGLLHAIVVAVCAIAVVLVLIEAHLSAPVDVDARGRR